MCFQAKLCYACCFLTGVLHCLCSRPQRLRCQRKEPCRLFTVRKRQELLDEVNTNTLCQCPHGHVCPRHHTDPGVIAGKSYTEEAIKTYSGYCISWTDGRDVCAGHIQTTSSLTAEKGHQTLETATVPQMESPHVTVTLQYKWSTANTSGCLQCT